MSDFNKETFMRLCPHVSKDAVEHNSDYIEVSRFPLDRYEYNYSHAIVSYLKSCGCRVQRTNWNMFGGFYIDYTRPTKYICPEEFADKYKGGTHLDSRTKWLFIFCALPFIVMVLMWLFTIMVKGN